MKYIQQRGNSFVFEDDGRELELKLVQESVFPYGEGLEVYEFEGVHIDKDLLIDGERINQFNFKDIKTAVAMMQILIDEGVV